MLDLHALDVPRSSWMSRGAPVGCPNGILETVSRVGRPAGRPGTGRSIPGSGHRLPLAFCVYPLPPLFTDCLCISLHPAVVDRAGTLKSRRFSGRLLIRNCKALPRRFARRRSRFETPTRRGHSIKRARPYSSTGTTRSIPRTQRRTCSRQRLAYAAAKT